MPGKPVVSPAATHNSGRNITGVAEAVLGARPAAVFLPQQRERHVRPTQFAMHHRPVRHRPMLARHIRRRRIEQRFQLRVVEPVRQRPVQPRQPGPAQIGVHRTDAQPQAGTDRPLAQPLREPLAQHLAYLPHRQSLARHSDPLLLGKGSALPMVEDCRQQRPTVAPQIAFMITGTGVHDRPESAFRINWNACSRSNGFGVHDPPERAPRCGPSRKGTI
jgi:hypothetical protein